MNDSRRVQTFAISARMLFEMLRPGERHFEVTGLPDDARFRGAYFDHLRNGFFVHVESETFAEVPDGIEPPQMWVELRRR